MRKNEPKDEFNKNKVTDLKWKTCQCFKIWVLSACTFQENGFRFQIFGFSIVLSVMGYGLCGYELCVEL